MERVMHAVVAFSMLATATHGFLSKERHTMLLAKDLSMVNAHMDISEKQARLESGASQMSSSINDVQSHLREAFLQFKSLVTPAKANLFKKNQATKQGEAKMNTRAAVMTAVNKTTKGNASLAANIKDRLQGEQSILENLFKHLKNNIANFNKEEKKGKVDSERTIQKLQARLKDEKAKLQNKGLNAFEHELLVNKTRMDEIELKYRLSDRDLGHQMFHTNLKLTHGLMARVKNVLAAYSDAFAKGHVDQEVMNKVAKEASPKAFV